MTQKTKSLDQNSDSPLGIIKYFFPVDKKKDADNALPLVKASNVLQNQGISKSHLKEAVAVLIGMLSSKLGDPIPMVITEDEGAGAVQLMDTCLNLMPKDSWIEVSNKRDSLDNKPLRGRTLVSYNGDGIKDLLIPILLKAERWNELHFRKNMHESREDDLNSFVVLVKGLNNPILQHPYVTRIHISADNDSKNQRIAGMTQDYDLTAKKQLKIETACAQTLLGRIQDLPVRIGFSNQIITESTYDMPNLVPIYDLALRAVRNIARINSSPPPEEYEPYASFIGLEYHEIMPPGNSVAGNELHASKLDYYYFNLIFRDLLANLNDFMTPRQLRVFNAIYKHHLTNIHVRKKEYVAEDKILRTLRSKNTLSGWPDRDEILGIVNSDSGEYITESTLFNELEELTRRNIIVKAKKPNFKRAKNIYAINQITHTPKFEAPDPSKIKDSILSGAKVEVVNILTGKTEKI